MPKLPPGPEATHKGGVILLSSVRLGLCWGQHGDIPVSRTQPGRFEESVETRDHRLWESKLGGVQVTEPASPFMYAGLSWRRRPSEAPGSRARPRSTSSRPADSFAGDEVTILGDVQAEEE